MAYAYDPLGRLKASTSGSGTGAVATTDTGTTRAGSAPILR